MTISIHSTIIAASLAASVAVAVASAEKSQTDGVASMGDRLVSTMPNICAREFQTTEARGDHLSVLASLPVARAGCLDR